MAKADLTPDRVRELFFYDPETGVFTRKVGRGKAKAGDIAGTVRPDGYRQICVDCRVYAEHRLAWLYVYGAWPKQEIDHINGNPVDNRIANLRDVTLTANRQNRRGASVENKSGYLGVYWHARGKKWHAMISVKNKTRGLGLYDTAEQAYEAYVTAKRRLHEGCTI